MDTKLFDSELKLLNLIWESGELSAQTLAKACAEQIGWSKTTTYTVIKKCIDKGVIERSEPGFICHALVTREQAQQRETDELIDKLYGGSPDMLVASLLNRKALSEGQIKKLKDLVDQLK